METSELQKCTNVLQRHKIEHVKTNTRNPQLQILSYEYLLVLTMSTPFTLSSRVDFGSSTNETVNPCNFAYGIQIRQTFVR